MWCTRCVPTCGVPTHGVLSAETLWSFLWSMSYTRYIDNTQSCVCVASISNLVLAVSLCDEVWIGHVDVAHSRCQLFRLVYTSNLCPNWWSDYMLQLTYVAFRSINSCQSWLEFWWNVLTVTPAVNCCWPLLQNCYQLSVKLDQPQFHWYNCNPPGGVASLARVLANKSDNSRSCKLVLSNKWWTRSI